MSADEGSIVGQIEFASFLIQGHRIPRDVRKSENYLRLSVDEQDVRGHIRLGVY
jgi:hypothetical protein